MTSTLLAGTQISDECTDTEHTGPVSVKGFATIDNVALINVEGTGMVGVQVHLGCTLLHRHRPCCPHS